MEIERRERDSDTGEMIHSEASLGGVFFDVFGKIAAKLTGKTAKKLATKATEKVVEKVGEKTGQLLEEKIYDKFTTKPTTETKGKEIGEILKSVSTPPPEKNKFQNIRTLYDDLI